MDGKRRWVENVVVGRLWARVKYEEIYLHAYDNIRAAKKSLGHNIEFYNTERKQQSLGDQTPNQLYYEAVAQMAAHMNGETLINSPTIADHYCPSVFFVDRLAYS